MTLAVLSPLFNGWQGFTPDGIPLSYGRIYGYSAGTNTALLTYIDSSASGANANPIVLGPDGKPVNEIWLLADRAYKFIVTDSDGNVLSTYDNISASSTPFFNVKTYGATGDGITDDTTSIAAAITSCNAAGGGIVYFPSGTYSYTTFAVLNYVRLYGAGRHVSTLASSLTSGNTITITGSSEVTIESLKIEPASSMGSGNVIYAINCNNLILRDILIDKNGFNCLLIDCTSTGGQFGTRIEDFVIGNCAGSGIVIGNAGLYPVQDTFITNGVIKTCTIDGIHATVASGIYVSDVDISLCGGSGFKTYPGVSQSVEVVLIENTLADSCTGNGFSFDATGGGFVAEVSLSNCFSSSNTLAGVETGTSANGISITSGTRLIHNGTYGVNVNAGTTNLTVDGCQIFNNSITTNNTYSGVYVQANTTKFNINNNAIGQGGYYDITGGTNQQKYGIEIAAGTSDHYQVSNNNLQGNVTASMIDGGTGTDKSILGNIPNTPSTLDGSFRSTNQSFAASGTGLEFSYSVANNSGNIGAATRTTGGAVSAFKEMDFSATKFKYGDALGFITIDVTNQWCLFGDLPGSRTCAIDLYGTIRSTGQTVANSGTGVEMSWNGSGGLIDCATRTGVAPVLSDFKPLTISFHELIFGNTVELARWDSVGNLCIGTNTAGSNAVGVIAMLNATAPTTSPANVGQLYVSGGELKYRNSSGTITALTPATGTGTVTSVSGTGTVSGLSLSGTVTTSGSLTLGGSLSISFPGWTAPTLGNSWTNYGGSTGPAGYYKDVTNGRVYLRGAIKTGTLGAAVFTLPAGSRPPYDMAFAVVGNVTLAIITISSAGVVIVQGGDSTAIYMDQISFQTN